MDDSPDDEERAEPEYARGDDENQAAGASAVASFGLAGGSFGVSPASGIGPWSGNKKANLCYIDESLFRAPIAQSDRASDFGSEGWEFESLWAH